MKKFFTYTRTAQVRKLDENGQIIPSRDDNGEIIPNKFETESKDFIDTFNISKVIRTHMVAEDHVIVLLDDGHETTEKTPELINPRKPATTSNIHEVKSRVWVQSEIHVKGAEVKELYEVLQQQ